MHSVIPVVVAWVASADAWTGVGDRRTGGEYDWCACVFRVWVVRCFYTERRAIDYLITVAPQVAIGVIVIFTAEASRQIDLDVEREFNDS